jgi:hypothetical protein
MYAFEYLIFSPAILYKYILLVRVICQKIPVERRGKYPEPL